MRGRASIKIKIMLLVLVSVLLPMMASTYISGLMVSQRVEKEFEDRVRKELDSALFRIEEYKKRARDNAIMLSNVTEIRQYVLEGEHLKASQYLVKLASDIGLDFILVADQNRKVLSRTDLPSSFGEDVSGEFIIKSGFAGGSTAMMKASERGLQVQGFLP